MKYYYNRHKFIIALFKIKSGGKIETQKRGILQKLRIWRQKLIIVIFKYTYMNYLIIKYRNVK